MKPWKDVPNHTNKSRGDVFTPIQTKKSAQEAIEDINDLITNLHAAGQVDEGLKAERKAAKMLRRFKKRGLIK